MKNFFVTHIADIKNFLGFGLSVFPLKKMQELKASEVHPLETMAHKVTEIRNRQTEISNLVMRLAGNNENSEDDLSNIVAKIREICLTNPQNLDALLHNIKKSALRVMVSHPDLSLAFRRFEEAYGVFVSSLLSHLRTSYTEQDYWEFQDEIELTPITIGTVFDQAQFRALKMPELWAVTAECRREEFNELISILYADKNGKFQVSVLHVEKVAQILSQAPVSARNRARLMKASFFKMAERIVESALQKELSQGGVGSALEKIRETVKKEFMAPVQTFVDQLYLEDDKIFC